MHEDPILPEGAVDATGPDPQLGGEGLILVRRGEEQSYAYRGPICIPSHV